MAHQPESDGRRPTAELSIISPTYTKIKSIQAMSPSTENRTPEAVAGSPLSSGIRRPMEILENYGFEQSARIDENHVPKPITLRDLESPRSDAPSLEASKVSVAEESMDPESEFEIGLKKASALLPLSVPATDGRKLAVILVGLPARGKSYIGRHLARYMAWRGHATRIFNVGNYRRIMCGSDQPHTFFDPKNTEGAAQRKACAEKALSDMLQWITSEGDEIKIGIYDATNSTKSRRMWIRNACSEVGVQTLFIESLCRDQRIVDANVRATKIFSPDYIGKNPDEAVIDFINRIKMYEETYEEVKEDDTSYIKIEDVGKKVVINDVLGYLPTRIAFFCMNMTVSSRPIYITRHGQSEYNACGKIGGNSGLTELGKKYAQHLSKFVNEHILPANPELSIWTSTLRRAIQTTKAVGKPFLQWGALDEIEAGEANGMTYEEMAENLPKDFEERKRDKLRYRYPRGESYQDLILRLDPVVMELERQEHPVLIVAHQAVLRVLFAYLTERAHHECPNLNIPLHTVIKLTPMAYGCQVRYYPLDEDIPETAQMHRVKS